MTPAVPGNAVPSNAVPSNALQSTALQNNALQNSAPPGCLACGGCELLAVERHRSYQIWRCPKCGLQFSDPMSGLTSHYAQAYDSNGAPPEVAGEALPFLAWTEQAPGGLAGYSCFLTAAQQLALKLARRRFPAQPPPVALDIGFGAGWFLGALQAAGFRAYGVEVAGAPVEALRRKGFSVCTAPPSQLPAEWPRPALITCFEVLEHLEDPLGFLCGLRRAHPAAEIMLSVPDEQRWFLLGGREAHDYPPNHLTRWSPPALARTLRKAGFAQVRVFRVRPTAQELSMAGLRRFLPGRPRDSAARSGASASPPCPAPSLAQEVRKRRVRRFLFSPLALILPLFGRTACSMLALAGSRPIPGGGPEAGSS